MQKEKLLQHLKQVIDRLAQYRDNEHFESSLLKKEALELYESALLLDYTEATATFEEAEDTLQNQESYSKELPTKREEINTDAIEDYTEEEHNLDQEEQVEEQFEAADETLESDVEEDSVVNELPEQEIAEEADFESPEMAEESHENTNAQVESGSLYERLSAYGGGSVLDKLQKKPIANLKEAIGINDRFSFINELFQGNVEAYSRAIEELNHLEDISSAQLLIEHDYVEKYKWDFENETVVNFLSLVERRYL